MIRVLVDDQSLVRGGFRMILRAESDISVVGEAGDGRQAVAEALRLRPDVVLMDVRMPVLDGIQAYAVGSWTAWMINLLGAEAILALGRTRRQVLTAAAR